ncbi:hypothetical protein HZC32_01175 [Candidatus Woesearchaeota archaeon]|nr:hypothetical protein [Candidatus Woesearchaeota archaeon]
MEFVPPSKLSQVAYFQREHPVTLHDKNYAFEIGKPEVLRDGEYATIVTTGLRTYDAVFATDILAQEGKRVKVVQLPTISNIDENEFERALSDSKNVMVIEEQFEGCGIGKKLRVFASERGLNYKHLAVDGYAGSDSYCNLLVQKRLDVNDIVRAVKNFEVGKQKRAGWMERFVLPAVYAAGLALIVGAGVSEHLKFRDCETVNNWNGTISVVCPTEINCGPLKSWEGEREDYMADGKKVCTYWAGGF